MSCIINLNYKIWKECTVNSRNFSRNINLQLAENYNITKNPTYRFIFIYSILNSKLNNSLWIHSDIKAQKKTVVRKIFGGIFWTLNPLATVLAHSTQLVLLNSNFLYCTRQFCGFDLPNATNELIGLIFLNHRLSILFY